jgi:translation initiation factor IF-3
VRLVGPAGEQVGIVSIQDALKLAQDADLDLVEVAPMARPPVAKLMDYGKFKYESALKARESRKNQAQTVVKEIKLRPKIDPHDYGTKKGHVERFLRQGDKVKVTIMFRGREQSRPELGFRLLQRLASDIAELGFVEAQPRQDGRNMIMVIGPHKKKSEARAERSALRAAQEQRASGPERPAAAARPSGSTATPRPPGTAATARPVGSTATPRPPGTSSAARPPAPAAAARPASPGAAARPASPGAAARPASPGAAARPAFPAAAARPLAGTHRPPSSGGGNGG